MLRHRVKAIILRVKMARHQLHVSATAFFKFAAITTDTRIIAPSLWSISCNRHFGRTTACVGTPRSVVFSHCGGRKTTFLVHITSLLLGCSQLMSYGSGAMIQIVKSRMKGIYHGDISLTCLTILLLSLITAAYTVGSG